MTGAGQGIGRAAALALAAAGANVLATSRTRAKLDDLPGLDARIEVAALDVTDQAAIDRLLEPDQVVDILVNAAGWVHTGSLLECSADDWAKSFDQNATSIYRTARAVLPGMLERGRGVIINVASVASSVTGVPNRAAYGASKAAVIGLTKSIARDYIDRGIRCIAVCPGTTLSPSLEERIADAPDPAAMRAAFVARQPMGRLGRPEEMAALIVHLASDEAAFTTGAVYVADGGQTL
ncbi:oxidoreductase [Roseibium aquae]|uniref:Oxidoreductase n=1 Tax=Roseibium aquae TaxID=1323746 RepID=A0A916X1R9_9HYPH|nr:oxidoreductase [Roseibium aquae]